MASVAPEFDNDDWGNLFLCRDVDGNEDANSEASDTDYEDEPFGITYLPDSEDEDTSGPAIQLHNTDALRANLQGKNLVDLIRSVLIFMDGLGINLPIFLDGLSWGDADCIQDAKIRYERSALMNSSELPGILRRWWKPPRSTGSKKKRPRGAAQVMEKFSAECTEAVLEQEMEAIALSLSSPAGEDIKEDNLTSLVFDKMINDMEMQAPVLWKMLQNMAYTPAQRARNTQKKPDKVRFQNSL